MNLSGFRARRWVLAGLLATLLAAPSFAADEKKAGDKGMPAGDEAQQKMMAEMMKNMTPGEQHQYLKPLVGKWKVSVKSWMAPGEPTISTGTCEKSWALGGRWVEESFKGDMMGMPFEGMGLTGYDMMKKQYVNYWFDTMSTTGMMSMGSIDDAHKVLTMTGTYDDPMTGKPATSKGVMKIVDDNTHVFSMYGDMGGKQQLVMECTYIRM